MMTFKPFSVNSLAAQPPEMPDPITMASKMLDSAMVGALSCVWNVRHVIYIEAIKSRLQVEPA
jgi:hypothetical protein